MSAVSPPRGSFGGVDIIAGNLERINTRRRRLSRIKTLQIYDILERITSKQEPGSTAADAVTLICEELESTGLLALLSISEKTDLCRRLYALLCGRGIDPNGLLFSSVTETPPAGIAFVDNKYSAAAYESFAIGNPDFEPRIYHSFSDMCDDVLAGAAGGCILPVENTTDGKLFGFYSLIDRSDLKICSLCDIYYNDDSQRTRYALLKRALCRPCDHSEQLYFELSISSTADRISTGKILSAAEGCSLIVYRIDSLPLRYDETSFMYNPVLFGSVEDILIFTIFLNLTGVRYTALGVSRILLSEIK